jgi:hypothetical protein
MGLNEDWVIVEPVDSDYNPVPYGHMSDKVELRMIADDRKEAFDQAKHDLQEFFGSKGLNVEVILSNMNPQADKISGKFKHIYKK